MLSYVYVAQDPTRPGMVKIGKANNPFNRIKNLSSGPGNPVEWSILGLLECKEQNEAYEYERNIHSRFLDRLYNKEWFNITVEDVKEYCLCELTDKNFITDFEELEELKASIRLCKGKRRLSQAIESAPTKKEIEVNYKIINNLAEIGNQFEGKLTVTELELTARILALWDCYKENNISYEKIIELSSIRNLSEALDLDESATNEAKVSLINRGFLKAYKPIPHSRIYCATTKFLLRKEKDR